MLVRLGRFVQALSHEEIWLRVRSPRRIQEAAFSGRAEHPGNSASDRESNLCCKQFRLNATGNQRSECSGMTLCSSLARQRHHAFRVLRHDNHPLAIALLQDPGKYSFARLAMLDVADLVACGRPQHVRNGEIGAQEPDKGCPRRPYALDKQGPMHSGVCVLELLPTLHPPAGPEHGDKIDILDETRRQRIRVVPVPGVLPILRDPPD